jgi:hypothetical protein
MLEGWTIDGQPVPVPAERATAVTTKRRPALNGDAV